MHDAAAAGLARFGDRPANVRLLTFSQRRTTGLGWLPFVFDYSAQVANGRTFSRYVLKFVRYSSSVRTLSIHHPVIG
jgi:hypothetical protein